MKITKVTKKYFSEWVALGVEFWSKHPAENIRKDFERMLGSKNEQSFICIKNNKPIGFINLAIRSDYVEGSKTSPVGYLEGIYVKKAYRKNGENRGVGSCYPGSGEHRIFDDERHLRPHSVCCR